MRNIFFITTLIITTTVCNFTYSQDLDLFIKNKKSKLQFTSKKDITPKKSSSRTILSNSKFFGMEFTETKKTKRIKILTQTYNGIEIFASKIKINYDDKGNVIFYNDNTINVMNIDNKEFPNIENAILYSNIKKENILNYKQYYFPISENSIIPSLKVDFTVDNIAYSKIFNTDYDIIYDIYLSIHKEINTSPANASVFMPDPITSAQTNYGENYKHNNGESNTYIEAQQTNVTIECNVVDNTYLLENNYIKIVDLYKPNWDIASSTTGNFIFNRSQIGFQQVNAFYHLNAIKQQINDYGFTDAVNYPLQVDADGENGDDNAHFHPRTPESDSRLEFGAYVKKYDSEGNDISTEHVPDAEDAEVLVHEYTHAIINSYSEERTTAERRSLEEAFADYVAVSYATDINPHNWQYVFKWDGHNEFWNGRMATSSKCYDDISFNSNIYLHTDIWVAPLMDIFFELGKETADKLVLHTITGLNENTTMQQAALIMMKMDSTYNDHQNAQFIFDTFKNYCILNDSHLSNEDYVNANFRIINSIEFSKGRELTLDFGELFTGEIIIYNINGVIVDKKKLNLRRTFNISSENLVSGLYLINIINLDKTNTFKVSKY